MTVEEKKALNKARVNAVRQAWVNESNLVAQGKCTRQWSKSEVTELNSRGRVSGYAGHHMKSVKAYPQYAGNPDNIQFLTTKEHIAQAHNNNTKAATNGYYNPQTKTTQQFHGRPQKPVYSLNSFNTSKSSSHSQTGSHAYSCGRKTPTTANHTSGTPVYGLHDVSHLNHSSAYHKGSSAYSSSVSATTGSTQSGKQSTSRSSVQSSASSTRSTSSSASRTTNASTTKTSSPARASHHSAGNNSSVHTGNSSGRSVQTASHSSGRSMSTGRANGTSNTNSM